MLTLTCKKDYNIYCSNFIQHNEYIKGNTYCAEFIEDASEDTYNIYPLENRKMDIYFYDNKLEDNVNVTSERYVWDYFYTPEEIRKIKLESL